MQVPCGSVAPDVVPSALFSITKMQLDSHLLQGYPFHLWLHDVRLLSHSQCRAIPGESRHEACQFITNKSFFQFLLALVKGRDCWLRTSPASKGRAS